MYIKFFKKGGGIMDILIVRWFVSVKIGFYNKLIYMFSIKFDGVIIVVI